MEFDSSVIYMALLLTFLAWLSTSIGAFIAFFIKKNNFTFLSFWLWFSAWVMIYISFVELMPESIEFFEYHWLSELMSSVWMLIFFAVWILMSVLLDNFIPSKLNPDDPKDIEELNELSNSSEKNKEKLIQDTRNSWLLKVWILTAVAIALHNFPEWLATFVAALSSIEIGIAIAIALALHNIPEWMAVSLPIYYATWSRIKAFVYASLSWMVNVLWALFWLIFVSYFFSEFIIWALFALVTGIMIFVSFHQLLPTASKYKSHHSEVYWVLIWMLTVWFIMLFL